MTFCPVVFHVLDKFSIPGRVRLIAVFPVYDEFRQQSAGKMLIDMGKTQDIKDIASRLPLLVDTLWLRAVRQARGIFSPLNAYVLDKF